MLLSNWLGTITSRIKKRPVYRSRDRRAMRRRWLTAKSNQISTAEVLEDRTLLTTFFVDDDFSGLTNGDAIVDIDPETMGDQAGVFGTDAFATIQAAVTAAVAGDTINIADGTYAEDVTVNTSVTLQGANAGIAAGVDPGVRGAESELTGGFRLFANDVVIDGLTIVDGTGPAGIGSQSAVFMTAGTSGHTIENNILQGPGTGVESRGVLSTFNGNNDNITIQNNEIYNWVAGIHNQGNTNVDIFGNNIHDVVVGIANDFVADVSIEGNAFSNASGGVGVFNNTSNGVPDVAAHNNFFDSSTLTELIGHYGGDAVDASGNWWGSTDETTIANSMKSDGVDGDASQVDFTSFLNNGADTNVGLAGFQGDFSTLNVTALGSQTGPVGRIQEAIANVTAGGTVNILSGTYVGNVDATGTGINKNVTLAPGNSPGQVVINGDLILNGDDALDIEIDGATAGTGFDQFVVNGTVNLSGAALNLIDGYDPADGDQFTLINNDSDDAVTGTLLGLPEGFEFVDFLGVVGQSAFLTYVGGDGNDVVIHVEDSTPEVTLPSNGTPDEYTIEIDGTNVVITEVGTGNIISSTPLASLTGPLVINGEDGQNDTLRLDMTGIDHTTPLQIVYNGGAGGFDTLELVNGSLASMEYFFANPSDGSIQLNGSGTDFITYTGLEPITSTVNATNVTLNYSGVSETITVTDAGGGQTTVNSTAGEILTFGNPTGTLTINAGGGDDIVNVNSLDPAFAANITINGEGNDDTVNLAAALTLGSGDTTINAEDVNVNGAVTTTGNVDINAGDTIVFALGGSIAAGASNLDLDALNNVELGQVSTTGNVTVTSTAGAINDANVGANNITAVNATLAAATGAGVGDALETNITALEANIGAGLEVDDTGTLDIGFAGGINGIMVGAPSTITSTGTMTVTENVAATGGNLLLQNTGGDFNLNALAIISNNSTFDIEIDSAGAVTLADTSTVTSSGTGLIDIDAVNNIALANLNTSGEVQVTTTAGSITDNTGTESALINSNTLALRAATGIGAAGAGDIDLAINTMAANTTAGDIFLQEPSAATVGMVNGLNGITAAGDISLVIGGTLTVSQNIEATGAASTILAEAQGNINVNAAVQTNGGTIDLLADADLDLNATSVVDTTSAAAVTLTADADTAGGGAFTQAEGSLVNAQGGMIDVTSTGNAGIANLQSAGGTIAIESTVGAILDNTPIGEAPLVTGDELSLRAATGVAAGGMADFDIAVNRLAASLTTGDMFVANNTAALDVGTVDGLSGVTVTAGLARLFNFGAITVNQSVTGDSVSIEVAGSAAVGDDLNINAGITSTGGDLDLFVGDNLNLATGVTLDSAAAIEILIDIFFSVDAEGGIANLNGILTAGTQITVIGSNDDDQVIIDGNGGALNDGGTVDGIQSLFTFQGGNGTDELIVDDSGDVSGDTITVFSTLPGAGAVIGAGPAMINLGFETLENLTLFTGTGADDITVNPNVLTTIDITGGDPTMLPGDSLTYLTPPGESSTFTPDGLDGGTIGATGPFQDVVFDEIESLTFGGSVVVDGTAGDDVLTITATGADSGTYQINGGPVINFSAVTDFTFNGDDGDDRLVINNPAGSLFDPSGGIFFNGEGNTGVGDTLEILGGLATTVEHRFTNANDGSVFFNGEGVATITYT
uniref:beta strand repeat-containing protein n=1 Tax=uncultured Gimesia sp. TaxID=1678688 RepID=UPI0030D83D28